jgi:hypothetical protein
MSYVINFGDMLYYYTNEGEFFYLMKVSDYLKAHNNLEDFVKNNDRWIEG